MSDAPAGPAPRDESRARPFVLGVDLDGVCCDHTVAFRRIVALERGVPEASLPLERSWGFEEWGLDDETFTELNRLAVVEHRMLRDAPVMEGASDVLWRLSDAGVWIRIITHRLYSNWGHATAAGDTAHWLDQARIPYRDLCFVGGKTAVDADAYIEDAPHNVAAIRAQGRTVIVFDQPYNRELPGPRARNWAEVSEMVTELVAAHNGGVQTQLPGIDAGADRLDRRLGQG
ncbi:MAG: hypothetical protein RIE08_05300 [Acidimicrobiales bacterium]